MMRKFGDSQTNGNLQTNGGLQKASNDDKIESCDKVKARKPLSTAKLRVAALVFAVVASAMILINFSPVSAVVAARKIPVYCVDRNDGKVALTFDAAWGADKTKQIMDVCDRFGVKATFFLVGFWSEKYPQLVKEIAERGFAIGTHSDTHPKMSGLSAAKIGEELSRSITKITSQTGGEVRLFRPPFGDYNNTLIEVASGMGLMTIQWSVDSLDWKGISAREIASRVLKAKSGDIILCHNNSDHIVEALPVIVRGLLDKGLVPVRLDEMVYFKNYRIDHTGRQILDKSDAV